MDEDEIKGTSLSDDLEPGEDELGDELDGDVLDVDPELLDGDTEV
jgi:hypothetical protein